MAFHFFTQSSNHRSLVFKEIHEIVFHGKGGYDWDTVYNMPIWLRKYTFNEIKVFYEKEREEYEKSMGHDTITANTPIEKFTQGAKTQAPVQKVNVPEFVSKVSAAKQRKNR